MCFLLSDTFKLYGEVSHQRSFPLDSYSVVYFVSSVIYILQGNSNNVHVIVCIDTARNCKTQQVKSVETVFSCNRVTVGKDISYFASAYAGFKIKLYCKSLCREFFFRNICKHFVGINKYCVSACRSLVRNTEFIKTFCKVFNLFDSCFKILSL